MKHFIFWLLGTYLLMNASSIDAQQPSKIPRLGFLIAVSPSAVAARIEAFQQGLRELGYVEGKNIVFEWQFAEGKLDRLPALAAELVRLKVDLIVTGGSQTTRPAKDATATIPIIMTNDNDPVAEGSVVSLARPGGNVTGLSNLAPELSGKRLEILKEIVPKLSRLAVFGQKSNTGIAEMLREIRPAAAALGIELQYLEAQNIKEVESLFNDARKARVDAVLVLPTAVLNTQRPQVAELAAKNRLPAIYPWPEYVDDGGLMSYSPNINDMFRRAATYVDKILKGAKPADIPVEQPIKFEFIVNLKAAKQIGLTIPPNVLVRADRVIR